MSLDFADIPQTFKRHVFACFHERPAGHPRGSCGQAGARPLWEHLMRSLDEHGDPEIGRAAAGCLGFCAAGPLMVVYPEGVWYQPKTKDDIDEIIATHLIGGAPVERLAVVPRV